jgi:hypothetical protein
VLNEDRGKAVVHSRLKNDGELDKLLDEVNEKLGPDNQAEPEPDQSMAVVSYCVSCEVQTEFIYVM